MGIEIPSSLSTSLKAPPDHLMLEKQVLPKNEVEKNEDNQSLISKEQIEITMDALVKTASILNHRLKYRINEEIGRIVVQVINAETDEIIKEIPPIEIQRLIARIKETLGLLVDEKA